MSSRQPSHDEIEALYTRISNFVSGRLRNTHNSPSLAARPMVHCPVLATHYKVPLSGVNQVRINGIIAAELDDMFPGWEIVWLPTPDSSQMEYTFLIPLDCAFIGRTGRSKKSHHRIIADASNGTGFERPLILLLFCLVLGLGGYQFLFLPLLK